MVGRSTSIIIPPELGDELSAILAGVGRGEPVDHYETVRLRQDGTRVEVSVAVSPIRDARGRVTGASTIARDITHRKEIEATRRERDVPRSVAGLAAGAAHEINNPLAVVMGQAQLLAREVGDAQRSRIEDILDAVGRIRGIVERMRHVEQIVVLEGSGNLPIMLDLLKSGRLGTPMPPARGPSFRRPGAQGTFGA